MTFSDHFKKSLKILAIAALLLLDGFLWLRNHIHDVFVPPHVTLPTNDKELITYNENRHTITVTTSSGTTTSYGRNPTVEIRKNGDVKISSHVFGTELRPFSGIGYSDTGRAYIGLQLLYFRQFDLSTSFGWTADNRKAAFQPMLSVGYNFWSNSSINIGMNPVPYILQQKPEIALFLGVRL